MFCHYVVQFQLENGLIGTIEHCVDDIQLYEGKSTRNEKHVVLDVDLIHLDINKSLLDLVRLRNQHRKTPYCLWSNNCKHFAFQALNALIGNVYYISHRKVVLEVNRFCSMCQYMYNINKTKICRSFISLVVITIC